jgi:hypothetical protein
MAIAISKDKRASILRTVVNATRAEDSGCDAEFPVNAIRPNFFERRFQSASGTSHQKRRCVQMTLEQLVAPILLCWPTF